MNIQNIFLAILIVFLFQNTTNAMEKEVVFDKKNTVLSLKKICAKSILKNLIKSNGHESVNLIKKIKNNHIIQNKIQNLLLSKYDLIFIDLFKECIFKNEYSNKIIHAELSKYANRAIIALENGTINIWDLSDINNILSFEFPKKINNFSNVEISPDGQLILFEKNRNLNLVVWDIADLENINKLCELGHNYLIMTSQFTPDSKKIISSIYNNTNYDDTKNSIILWDLSNQNNIKAKTICSFNDNSIIPNLKIFQIDNKTIILLRKVTLTQDQHLTLDISNLDQIKNIKINQNNINEFLKLERKSLFPKSQKNFDFFSHLSEYSPSDTALFKFNPLSIEKNSNTLIKVVKIHNSPIKLLLTSNDQSYVLSGAKDSLKLWKISKDKSIKSIILQDHSFNKSFSHKSAPSEDFRFLITIYKNQIFLWKLIHKRKLSFDQILLISKINHLMKHKENWKNILQNEYFKNTFNSFSKEEQKIINSFFLKKNYTNSYFIPHIEEKNTIKSFLSSDI